MVEHAGLGSVVEVVHAASSDAVQEFVQSGLKFELIFLDHVKDLYAPDAQALEQGGCLVAQRSVVVADNCVFPGCPQYLEWVRGCGLFDTEFHAAELEYTEKGGKWDVYGKARGDVF